MIFYFNSCHFLCYFHLSPTFSIISIQTYACILVFGFFYNLAFVNIGCFLYYFAFLIIILLTQTIQQMIKQYKCLHYLSQLIPPAFQHSQYQTILKACRPISTLLAYLSNYIRYDLTLSPELQTQLQNCLQVVQVIIKSTQFQKFGHRLPLLAYTINKFSLRKQPEQYRIKSRRQLNIRSPEYVYNNNDEICEREKNFLKSPIFSIVNDEITKNQIILQNPQCVCCSLVFVKDMEIFNCNPYYSSVLDICPQSAFDKITVQRHVCALCNLGGGVILIGAQKINNVLKAVGIKFQSISEIQQKQAEMSQAISWIQPTCKFLIQRLIVHTNYISQENVAEQHLRICFRIIIFSGQQIKINFIQICIKGQQRSYQICQLGQKNKIQIINSSTQLSPQSENFYKIIHRSYKTKKSLKNIHKYIFCFRPHQFYSKLFNDQYNKGLITKEQLEKNINAKTNVCQNSNYGQHSPDNCTTSHSHSHSHNNNNNKSAKDQEICFKFKYSCLLVVASVNHDRDVDSFVDELQEEGHVVSVQRPFPHLFDTSSISSSKRSIWLVCHQISPSEIRNRLTQYQQSQILKKSSIKMLPVSTTLQIESTKSGEQEVLKKRIKQRYNQGYKSEIGESYDKKMKGQVKHLKFNNRSQAVFAYLVLEELGIRPFFIKDNAKKK